MGLWKKFMDWLRRIFFKQEMELTLVGLQNAGKTTLVELFTSGEFHEDMIPTVGFNMKKVTKGKVQMKFWDVGGQTKFRSMWERYCRGVSAIVFVVDAADRSTIETAKRELHSLVTKRPLAKIPLLVLGNKNDLKDALTAEEMISVFELDTIDDREVFCYSISAKNHDNIDKTMDWLIRHAKKRS